MAVGPRCAQAALPLPWDPRGDRLSCNLQPTLCLRTRPECAVADPGTGPKEGLWSPVLTWEGQAGLPQPPSVLPRNSVLTRSTRDCVRSRRGRAQSHKPPAPPKSTSSPGLQTDCCRSEVPGPSVGSIHLLEWLPELRNLTGSLVYGKRL